MAERKRRKLQATEQRLKTELDNELLAMEDLDGSLSLSQSLTLDSNRVDSRSRDGRSNGVNRERDEGDVDLSAVR